MFWQVCTNSRGPMTSSVCGLLAAAWISSSSMAQSYPDDSAGASDIGVIEEYSLYPVTAPQPGEPRPIRFVFSTRGEYQFDTGLDRAGDFSLTRANAGLGFSVPIADRFGIAIGTSLGIASYDFDRAAVFGGGRPWEAIYTGQVSAVANYTLDDAWTVFGGAIFGLAGEEGADFSDSITGGGMIGAGYRHSEGLIVRFGLSVMSQIEDDAAVMPVILVDWAIDDRWRLRMGSLDTGSADVIGAGLNYRISEQWSAGGRLSWVHSRFRLDDSGFAPEGVGQDDRFKATLVLNWRATDHLDLGLLGGVVFGGTLRVEDQDGGRLFEEDYDPTGFAGVRLAWRF
jgi:hypothetical protein